MVNTWLFRVCIFSCIGLDFLMGWAGKIYVIVQIYYIVDFVLVGSWFFSCKGVFHINPCACIFPIYFSILVYILLRLISGYFPNKWYQSRWFLGNKMSSMKFDVENFDGRINFGLWQVQVKYLLI